MVRLASAILIGLTACSPIANHSASTAIYVPPSRLGGQGSVMFIPASAASAPNRSDDALFRTVLKRLEGKGSCVTPVLSHPPFTDLRRDMIEAGTRAWETPERLEAFVRPRVGQWRDENGPIDSTLEARLTQAVIAIVDRDKHLPLPRLEGRRADGPKLPESWLSPGQLLGEQSDCTQITLSEVASYGSLAFVDVSIVHGPLAGSGERWALERLAGVWSVVAAQALWIS